MTASLALGSPRGILIKKLSYEKEPEVSLTEGEGEEQKWRDGGSDRVPRSSPAANYRPVPVLRRSTAEPRPFAQGKGAALNTPSLHETRTATLCPTLLFCTPPPSPLFSFPTPSLLARTPSTKTAVCCLSSEFGSLVLSAAFSQWRAPARARVHGSSAPACATEPLGRPAGARPPAAQRW